MAVITARGDLYDIHTQGTHCSICGKRLLHPPFLAWMTKTPAADLFICAACCRDIKNGLVADLTQVCAITKHELAKEGQAEH